MRLSFVRARARHAVAVAALLALGGYRISTTHVYAQAGPRASATPQKLDEDYTARIRKATPDPRIITEDVDHMPASAAVPAPPQFFREWAGGAGHPHHH